MERPRITLALALVGVISAVALLSAPYVRAEEEFVDCRVTTCTSNDWVVVAYQCWGVGALQRCPPRQRPQRLLWQ